MYNPKPIDTKGIILSQDIINLGELIAKNVHDNWAKGRIEQGWKYGPKRDDIKKETPTLVPYEELPESEKEFDRKTALETLKTIQKLGYKIKKE